MAAMTQAKIVRYSTSWLFCIALLGACSADEDDSTAPVVVQEGTCQSQVGVSPEFLKQLGCRRDFDALASVPIDANLPGARSVKVVLDQADGALYFQNSTQYPIHYQFASTHLSGGDRPLVSLLAEFNRVQYYDEDRRFILGAVTYYENPNAWTFELAPYDTASAEMIAKVMGEVRKSAYFGPALVFHPTSRAIEDVADKLGPQIKVMTTDELYRKIDYQPLSLGTGVGRLHRLKASQLATEYVSYRDIVVLDQAPNDISVVSGIITEQFQTPLSHVNILSQNRGTPNMGLRNATTDPRLAELDGKWVELSVKADGWTVREVTQAEADAFFEAHKPPAVTLPKPDITVTGLWNIEDVVPEQAGVSLRDGIGKAVLAFGGKAAHYSILVKTPGVPIRKAFAVPMYYYDQFMRENGFYAQIDTMLADPQFVASPEMRDTRLAQLRGAMMDGPVDATLQQLLRAKIEQEYPTGLMRFRTSTNSEDLVGFPCAGCYESHTGDPKNWENLLDAIRETWASIWLFRTFEERTYYGIDHHSVGMALLVHYNFPNEEANGVAVTANPFDASGLEPGFYINVQWGGDAEVVAPPPGVTSDEFLYFFSSPNQPTTFLSHSNLVPEGETVLSARQTNSLGKALQAIHERFAPAYMAEARGGLYAMDIEFKFDGEPGQEPTLFVKQARPYKGRGGAAQ